MKKIRAVLPLILLTLGFLPLGSIAQAACNRPVDPNRIVIFVGLNEAFLERKAAEEAACLRGESFTYLPRSLPGEEVALRSFKEFARLETNMQELVQAFTLQGCLLLHSYTPSCISLQSRVDELSKTQDRIGQEYKSYFAKLLSASHSTDIMDEFSDLLKDLATRRIQPTAVILSGHSAGKGIWGLLGSMHFSDIQDTIHSLFAGNEKLLSSLDTILLWGCNTIDPYSGANSWIRFLPSLKLIFGFQGSAPSSMNPASPALLLNILRSGPNLDAAITSKSPEKTIKNVLDAIRGIENTVGSAYINDLSRNQSFYYERTHETKGPRDTWTSTVKPMYNIAKCEVMRPQLEADQNIIKQVLQGEIEIPTDTSGGLLREVYTRARRNELCRVALGLSYSADQAGYVLFWNNLKKNVVRFFSEKTAVTMEILKSPTLMPQLENDIKEFNRNLEGNKLKGIQNLRAAIAANIEDASQIALEYQAYQDAAEEMPWGGKNERRLKKLEKKIAQLEKKSTDSLTLATLRTSYNAQIELRKISGAPDFDQKLKEVLNGLTSRREIRIEHQKSHESELRRMESEKAEMISIGDAQSILRKIIESLPPTTVAETESMGMGTFRAKVSDAAANVLALRMMLGSLPSKTLSTLVDLAYILEGYRQLAVELQPSCLDFQNWHDYLEDEKAPKPKSNCY